VKLGQAILIIKGLSKCKKKISQGQRNYEKSWIKFVGEIDPLHQDIFMEEIDNDNESEWSLEIK